MVSKNVLSELAVPTMSPLMVMVDEVSSKPPSTVSLLFSELSSPVLSTAKANTAATTTKAIRTMAVSSGSGTYCNWTTSWLIGTSKLILTRVTVMSTCSPGSKRSEVPINHEVVQLQ